MKKRLVASLAAAMVLGVAGSAFAAANPFVDVPAKHWSYDAVSSLAKAGIVDGYGDGTFKGDKTITRYEMAQIVAKAMGNEAKANAQQKAEIKKLQAEYADELDKLGVRVGNLEKRVGTIRMTGDARIRMVAEHNQANLNALGLPVVKPANDTTMGERFRLNMTADVNENTSFYGRLMLMNHTEMGANEGSGRMTDAAFTTKNAFGTDSIATVGRFSQKFMATGYWADTLGMVDGAKVTVGNKLKVTTGFANWTQATGSASATAGLVSSLGLTGPAATGFTNYDQIQDAFFMNATYSTSKATTLNAMWLKETTGSNVDSNFDVKGLGVVTKFAPNLAFTGEYYKNTSSNSLGKLLNNSDPVAWVARVAYRGANPSVAGSWGAALEYRKFDLGINPINNTLGFMNGAQIPVQAIKGFSISASKAIAKNITFDAMQTFNSKSSIAGVESVDVPNYTRAQINYFF